MFGLEKPWMKGCWELWWQWEEMIHFSSFLEQIDYAGSEREKMQLIVLWTHLGEYPSQCGIYDALICCSALVISNVEDVFMFSISNILFP